VGEVITQDGSEPMTTVVGAGVRLAAVLVVEAITLFFAS
jgi:hypothetical protein